MFSKKFKIGLVNVNVSDFNDYTQYINSYYVGISPLDEMRLCYVFIHRLREMIENSKKQNCDLWVTYNTLTIPNKLIKRKIDTLMDIWTEYKFTGYIISDTHIASKILNFKVPVTISTVADIRDLNDVDRLYQMGFKNIVLSYKVNRNFDFVSECCSRYPDVTFTLVVNELCESNCPYRTSHFLRVGCGESSKFQCLVQEDNFRTDKWKLKVMKNTFLAPENLLKLESIPNLLFKLATRTQFITNKDIVEYIEKYIGKTGYDSIFEFFKHHMNIKECDILKPKIETIMAWQNCKNQCYKCNICNNEVIKQ